MTFDELLETAEKYSLREYWEWLDTNRERGFPADESVRRFIHHKSRERRIEDDWKL